MGDVAISLSVDKEGRSTRADKIVRKRNKIAKW